MLDIILSIDWEILLGFLVCLAVDVVLGIALRTCINDRIGAFYTIACICFLCIVGTMTFLLSLGIYEPMREVQFLYEP